MEFRNKHILFAISSMGLGHVYRTLPIIRFLLKSGNKISIASDGRALTALKVELAEYTIDYHTLQPYPTIQGNRGFFQDSLLLKDLIHTGLIVRKERQYLQQLIAEQQIDMVFSDGRFGFTSDKIPCFLICHQIRFMLPLRLFIFQPFMDFSNYCLFRKFTKVIVPDHADPKENLSGKLSHNWLTRRLKPLYIGFLSSVKRINVSQSIDILFITGGYIECERKRFIAWAKQHLATSNQRIVIVQGEHSDNASIPVGNSNVKVLSNISGVERDQIMSAAKLLVGRSGYTTLMDICELKIQAVLSPTPRMTEQAYLARRAKHWQHPLPDTFKTLSKQSWVAFNSDALPEKLKTWSTEQSIQQLADFLSSYSYEKR